jgi:hypothetical protein
LREPGKEFSLVHDETGKLRFQPAHYGSHVAACSEPWSLSWTTENPFQNQPVKIRIEVVMSAGSYDDPGNVILADLSDPNAFAGQPRAADGVTVKLSRTAESNLPQPAGTLAATNSGKVPRNAAWARLDRKFDPCLNLKDHQALGVWVEGDGLGEIIAIRLESPRHISYGAVADRYMQVDFAGRRSFTLVETESVRWSDYSWDDGKWLYNVYRETIDFATVESLSIWYNNLPKDREAKCLIGPIKALPMVPCTVKNPIITLNDSIITLPVEVQSGGRVELIGSGQFTVFGSKGETLAKGTVNGAPPLLRKGRNNIRFSCDQVGGPDPRVKVTVISYGSFL